MIVTSIPLRHGDQCKVDEVEGCDRCNTGLMAHPTRSTLTETRSDTVPPPGWPNPSVSPRRPKRLHVALDTQATGPAIHRVRATDLRRAAAMHDDLSDPAGAVIAVLDVEFLIAPTARAARTEYRNRGFDKDDATTVRYVGTPGGLAGLIADIGAVGVADGVVLIGLDDGESTELLSSTTLPRLLQDGIVDADTVAELRAGVDVTARESASHGGS